MGLLDDLRQKGFNITPELYREIIDAQIKIMREAKQTPFYECITVEFHDNGVVKKISKSLDWKVVLTFGVAAVILGCVTIYYVGPENIVKAVNFIMQHKGLTSMPTALTAAAGATATNT